MKILFKLCFLAGALYAAALGLYAWDLHRRFPDLDLTRTSLGVASWYSRSDPGINKHTANGEVFNDKGITCASWDYAFGEKLLVINTMNGKWVVCRVNDRGPHKRLKRKIDLTQAAFAKIANKKRGLIRVTIIPTVKRGR
jgi:rare lipoprotein A